MFSTDFIFRQQENLVDNQKCQAGFRPLCNKILLNLDTEAERAKDQKTRMLTHKNISTYDLCNNTLYNNPFFRYLFLTNSNSFQHPQIKGV